ncbi:MAG: LysR family transcriptional regulator [Caulobacteraceae bacterium]
MTLEQLRIFVAVAEHEHMTRAAEALHLTQSAVSGAIAALEARHGVRLFDRIGRNIELNSIGRGFLLDARAVLSQAAAAEATLEDLSLLRRGRISIHASQTIASYWLPRRLSAFHIAYPEVELELRIGNTQQAADAVRGGTADLGYVEGELDDPLLEAETVGEDRLVLLVKADHPWARRAQIGPAELVAQTWVAREAGSGTRSSLEAGLRAVGVNPAALKLAFTLPSNEAVLAAAEAGAGAAALSESVAAFALASGSLVKVRFQLPSRAYRLLRHKARYRTRASEAFVAVAQADRSPEPIDSYQI